LKLEIADSMMTHKAKWWGI